MKLRESVDPELSLLRAALRCIDDQKLRASADTARFQLFAALEADDRKLAKRWLNALRAHFNTTDESVTCALNRIEQLLG